MSKPSNYDSTSRVFPLAWLFGLVIVGMFTVVSPAEAFISGTLYTDAGVTPAPSGITVGIAVGTSTNSVYTVTTTAGGVWSLTGVGTSSIGTTTPITVWLDASSTDATTMVMGYRGQDITEVPLYYSRVVSRGATTTSQVESSRFGFYDFDDDADILLVTATSATSTRILADFINNQGTFIALGTTLVFTGSYQNDAIFNNNFGAQRFTGSSKTLSGTLTGTSTLGRVEITGSYTISTFASTTDLLIESGGSFTAPSTRLSVSRKFSNSGTFTSSSGEIYMDGLSGSVARYLAGRDSIGSTGAGNVQMNTMAVSGSILYVGKAGDAGTCDNATGTGCELMVFDISSSTNPVYVAGRDASGVQGTGPGGTVAVQALAVSGTTLYVGKSGGATACSQTSNTAGARDCELMVFDISSSTNPVYVRGIDSAGNIGGVTAIGINTLAISSGALYVGLTGTGAVACSQTASTTAASNCELQVYNISSTTDPVYVAGRDSSGGAASTTAITFNKLLPFGNVLYVGKAGGTTACSQTVGTIGASHCELQMYDISSSSNPVYAGGRDASGAAAGAGTGGIAINDIAISTGRLYAVKANDATACSQAVASAVGCELMVFDIGASSTNPVYLAGRDASASDVGLQNIAADSVVVSGDLLYMSKATNATACSQFAGGAVGCELMVFDVSSTSNPIYVAGIDANAGATTTAAITLTNVLVSGNVVYVTKANSNSTCSQIAGGALGCELMVFENTTRAKGTLAGTLTGASALSNLVVAGNVGFTDNASTTGFTVLTNATTTAPRTLSVSGDYTNNGVVSFLPSLSEIVFSGASAQALTGSLSSSSAFSSVTFTGAGVKTINSPMTVTGNFSNQGSYAGNNQLLDIRSQVIQYVTSRDSGGTAGGSNNTQINTFLATGTILYVGKNGDTGTCSDATGTGCELMVFDISSTTNPVYVAGRDASGIQGTGPGGTSAVQALAITTNATGTVLYVGKSGGATACSQTVGTGGARDCELSVFDISSSTNPVYLKGIDSAGDIGGVTAVAINTLVVASSTLYVGLTGTGAVACSQTASTTAASNCELQVYNIASTTNPIYVAGRDSAGGAASTTAITFNKLLVSSSTLYVAKGSGATTCSQTVGTIGASHCELQMYNISSSTNPVYVGGRDASAAGAGAGTGNIAINDIAITGNRLYAGKAGDATACSQAAGSAVGCELMVFDIGASSTNPVYLAGRDADGSNLGLVTVSADTLVVSNNNLYMSKAGSATRCSAVIGLGSGCELMVFDISSTSNPMYTAGRDIGGTDNGIQSQTVNNIALSDAGTLYVGKVNSGTACLQATDTLTGCELLSFRVASNLFGTLTGTSALGTTTVTGKAALLSNASTTNLTISASSTLVAPAVLSVSNTFNNQGGNFLPNGGLVVLSGTGNQSLLSFATTTFHSLTKSVATSSTLTFTASSTYVFGGTLTLTGTTSNLLSLRSSANGTQWNILPQATTTVLYANVRDSNNLASSSVSCLSTCVNSGNNNNWLLPEQLLPLVISGTLYSDTGLTPIATSKTIKVAVGTSTVSVYSTSSAVTTGDWTISVPEDHTMGTATPLIIYVDGDSVKAVTITKASSTANISGIPLYQDYVVVKNEATTTVATTTRASDFTFYDSTDDADVTFAASSTLMVDSGKTLFVFASTTFLVDIPLQSDNFTIATSATALASSTVSVGSDLVNRGSFFGDAGPISGSDSWTFSVSSIYNSYTGQTGTQSLSSGGLSDNAILGGESVWGSVFETDPYIIADFGATQLVESIYVAPIYGSLGGWGVSYLDNATFEYSLDGSSWTFVATATASVEGQVKEYSANVTARYIRLIYHGDNFLGVGELYFGPPGLEKSSVVVVGGDYVNTGAATFNLFDLNVAGTTSNSGSLRSSNSSTTFVTSFTNTGTSSFTSGSLTATGAVSNEGTLTSTSSAIFNFNNDFTNTGTSSFTGGIFAVAGVITNDGSISASTSAILNLNGNLTNNGTVIFEGGGGALVDIIGIFINNSDFIATGSAQINFANDFTNNGTAAFGEVFVTVGGNYTNFGTAAYLVNSEFIFDGSTTQTATGTMTGVSTFGSVSVYNSSGDGDGVVSVIFGSPVSTVGSFYIVASSSVAFLAGATSSFQDIGLLGGDSVSPVYLRSTVDGAPFNLVVPGTRNITFSNIKDSNACSEYSNIDVSDGTSVDRGGNSCWDFPVPPPPASSTAISGVLYADAGVTPMVASKTINLAVSTSTVSVYSTTSAATTGFWTISIPEGHTLGTGTPFIVYVDGDSVKAVTISRASSTADISDVPLYQNHVVVKNEAATIIATTTSASDFTFYDSADDADVTFAASSTLMVDSGRTLLVLASTTFKVDIPLMSDNLTIATSGVMLASSTVTVGGNYVNNGTAIIATTTYFTGTSKTISGTLTGTSTLNDVVVSGSYAFSNNASTSDLSITSAGALTAPAEGLSVAGNYANNGTFINNSGTVTFAGANKNISGSLTASSSFNNLAVSSGANVDVSTELTVTGNYTNNGTLESLGKATTTFTGASKTWSGNGTSVFANVDIQGTYTSTHAATTSMLTIASSKSLTSSANISVRENLINNGVFNASSGGVTFLGASSTISGTLTGSSTLGNVLIKPSGDGGVWTSRSAGSDARNNAIWNSVTYANGVFLAVGNSNPSMMISSDGVTWSTTGSVRANRAITYSKGLFVVVGTHNAVVTSPDGTNWTEQSAAGDDDAWTSVTYGNGLFVAVGRSGDRVMTSPDGIGWTARSAAGDNDDWTSVTYGNGLFVAVGRSGDRVMTSPDGIGWTARSAAGDNDDWNGVTYGNGLFVAVGNSGDRVMTSPDGVTWTARSAAGDNDDWYGVTYGNGLFVAVGRSGDRVMTSPDGIGWTARSAAGDNDDWNGVTYGNGTLVAVGYGTLGFSDAVMTSATGTLTMSSAASTTNLTITSDNTLIAPTQLSIAGNYTNSGTFTAGTGTTTFDGVSTQVATGTMTGTSAFSNLRITNTSGDGVSTQSVVFGARASSTGTFSMASSTSAAFAAGATSSFQNINWQGGATDEIYLRSTVPGVPWGLIVPGVQEMVMYVNVRDSNACSGYPNIDADDRTSVNSGNNTCWSFPLLPTISSADDQSFVVGSSSTAISTITITESISPTITSVDNIRIAIATSSIGILFDTTDTTAVFGGTASGKVSGTVSYEGGGSVLVVNVTTNFAASDTLTIDGLSFTSFATATPAVSALQLFVDGASDAAEEDSDDKTIAITGSLTISEHSGGQVANAFSGPNNPSAAAYALRLVAAHEPIQVASLALNLSGVDGLVTSDVTNVLLYRDNNSNKSIDAGDVAVGGAGVVSISGQVGTITFSSPFTATTTQDYLVVFDAADTKPADMLALSLVSAGLGLSGTTSLQALAAVGGVSARTHIRLGSGGRSGASAGVSVGSDTPTGDGIVTGGGGGGGVDIQDSGDSIGNEVGFAAPSGTGSTHNEWTNGSNAYTSNGSYAISSTGGQRQSYSDFNFNIPSGNLVNGIEVKVEARASSSGGTFDVILSWNSESGVTSAKTSGTLTTTDSIYTLGISSDTWGRSWTPEELADANFRLRLVANPSGGNAVYVDAIQVKIHHSASGGGGGGGADI